MKVNKGHPRPSNSKEVKPEPPKSMLIPIVFEMLGDESVYFGYVETLPGLDNRPWMSRQGICVPPDVASIAVQELRVAYSNGVPKDPIVLAVKGPDGDRVSLPVARATVFGTPTCVLSVTQEAESAWLSAEAE